MSRHDSHYDPAQQIAVIKAVDAYLVSVKASADAIGRHWVVADRQIEEEYQDPSDAGMEAFLASLARSNYNLVRIRHDRPTGPVDEPSESA